MGQKLCWVRSFASGEAKAAYNEGKVMVKFGLPCRGMRFPRNTLADLGFGA